MARIACIMVPDFPIAAIVRANPALEGAALAIAASSAAHAEIVAVSADARALGICAGMTLAQARAICAGLIVNAPAPAAENSAHQALADAAESISPIVEPGAPGCVWLDLAGLGRIFASEDELAVELQRRVRKLGMEAAIGVGGSREIAAMAARCGGVRVIDAGREREFVDWLPLEMLDPGAELETTFSRWGMRRLGDLARLDPDAIGSRLGRRGVELVRLARGGSSRPIVARPRAEIFAEAAELDYAIDNLEPLGFVIRGVLERIVARLHLRGFAAGDAMIVLGLEDHRIASRRIAIAAPTCDVRAILTLINLALEAAPPEAAVETVRLEVTPRAPRPAQSDMFLPPAPAPDKLAATIARLAALCGPGNVGALSADNSYRPEAVRIEPFDPPPARPDENGAGGKPVAQLVIRALRPALEIEVMQSRGGPEFVRGPNLGARVVSIAGPWRRDGEWWKTDSYHEQPQERGRRDGGPTDIRPLFSRTGVSPVITDRDTAIIDSLPSGDAAPNVFPLPPGEGNAAVRRVGEGERPIARGHSSPPPESREARTEQPSPSREVPLAHGRRTQRAGEGEWPITPDHSSPSRAGRGQGLGRSDHAVASNHPERLLLAGDARHPPRIGEGIREDTNQNLNRAPLRCALETPSPGRVPVAPPFQGEGSKPEERSRGFLRDYYELALDDGGVYRVFRDLNSDRWFLDGVYD